MIKSFVRRFLPLPLLAFYHRTLAGLADFWYRHPSNELIVIGVTGTNGKSTVVSLIGQLLEHAGHRVGWTSTASFKIGHKEWLNDKKMTMLGRFQLQKLLRQMVTDGCEFVIVETSSEGIKQSRHLGINYDVAVLTNLTPEHIESHGGFENYKNAKLDLFRQLTRKPQKKLFSFSAGEKIPKIAVVNGACPYAKEFLAFPADKKIAYVVDGDVELTQSGSHFHALGVDMTMPLLGRFNVENALAAISVVKEFGMSPEAVAEAVVHLKPVPGRLERIAEGQPFTVIVDYAADPDSMAKLYEVTELIPHKRVLHVFGSCGGGRDVARRPLLGRLAGAHADVCIVTNEDPYDDDPMQIMQQVAAGAREVGKQDDADLFVIEDRRQAIIKAIAAAQADDLVLITGKACEQGMMVAGGKMLPWDDRVEVRKALHRL